MNAYSLALLALLALAPLGCSGKNESTGVAEADDPRAVIVRGTVVDADTRAPVKGATIQGPGGVRATSDAAGRFSLSGMPVGASGDLVATTPDGGQARNPLLPLRPGTLEVVLHVRRP
jgi:hypothetical protein